MRKITTVLGLAAIAFAVAQSGSGVLSNFTKTLNNAKSVSASYKVTDVGGGTPRNYTVDLAKPNLARVDSPTETIVADGTNITTYTKSDKTYYKKPQTQDDLMALFGDVDTNLFRSFFDADTYKAANAKDSGTKNRKGVTYNVVELSYPHKTTTLYVDNTNLAKQAEVVLTDTTGAKSTTMIIADNFTIDNTSNDKFAFKAPDGARELSAAEMNSAKWYENYDEAKKVASRTGKLVMIDFYTDWCHWCKVLDAEVYPTKEFKAMSKYFVFCKIDAEKQASVAAPFNITGYPDIRFTKADGSQVHQILGYKPLDEFLAEMEKAKSAGGLGN